MVLLYWYAVIGVVFGLCIAYAMVDMWGWKHLCEDFNKTTDSEKYKFNYSISQFKIVFPLLMVFLTTFTWPYFIYTVIKKHLK